MYYGEKTIEELDQYYNIDVDMFREFPHWMEEECIKIQKSFKLKNVLLTLRECKELYSSWSDETHCAGWENGLEYLDNDGIFNLLLPWLKEVLFDRIQRLTTLVEELETNGYMDDCEIQ